MSQFTFVRFALLVGMLCAPAAGSVIQVVTVDAASLQFGTTGCAVSLGATLFVSCEARGPADTEATVIIRGTVLCNGSPCIEGASLPFTFTTGASDDTNLSIGLSNPLGGEDLFLAGGYGEIGHGGGSGFAPAYSFSYAASGYPDRGQPLGFELLISATSYGGPSRMFPLATGYSVASVELPLSTPEPSTLALIAAAGPLLLLVRRRLSIARPNAGFERE